MKALTTEKNSLINGPVGRTLLMFALPFLASSFLQALYGAVDLLVVGQFSDSASVSAVAIGSQMMQTITGIVLGISMGGTVLIGRRIGDLLLTGMFGLGAAGAAVATVLAQGVSFLSSLYYIYKKGLVFPFGRKDIRADKASMVYILKVGLPLAMQDALVNVSFLVITAIINTMGVIASAAVGVVEKIIVFAMLPPSAFASAVAPMTSQNMGAGKWERAKKSLWCGTGYSLICGICVCLYCQFFPETLTSLFARDPQVVTSAARYLKTYSIDCIFVSFVFCINAYFSGCGKSVISFAHSMAATFGVRIPATLLLSQLSGGSLLLLGFAAPAASLLSIGICLLYLRWDDKKRKLSVKA